MRRILAAITAVVLLAVLIGAWWRVPAAVDRAMNRVVAGHAYPVSEAAARLHRTLVVADLHDDLLLWGRDVLARGDRGHTDVPRLIEGHVAVQVFSAVTKVPRGQNYENNPGDSDMITPLAILARWPSRTWRSLSARAVYQAGRLRDAAARSNGRLSIVTTAADLDGFLERRQELQEAVAGVLAIEGLHALAGDLRNVDTLFREGYRMMGLAHFFDNEMSGSAHGLVKGGLTPLGRQAVARMEQLGIVVDLAHASPRAFSDALDIATRPVVVSHTGVQGTCAGPRNLTDEQIRRVAANGGVIGIGFWDGAVCDEGAGAIAKAIRYTADRAGVEHVALGSDFDGATTTPFDAAGLAQITAALLDANFTEGEIRLIMGENAVRLLRQALPRETTR
jgi:membrane dipeptidase